MEDFAYSTLNKGSENGHLESDSTSNRDCCYILLRPHQRSHYFDERRIDILSSSEKNPIKIGRTVGNLRPDINNAIFDCKVLSRNHATIWIDSTRRVWLRDTQSSNGTLVNSLRLSKVGEDSLLCEIFSGDIVQFGVEVVESETIHGCIIAIISIHDSDGIEIPRVFRNIHPDLINSTAFSNEEIFQISNFLQESLYREKELERKMSQLHVIMKEIDDNCLDSWQVFLNEERLLSKVKFLESQLEIYSLQLSDDNLRKIAADANNNTEETRLLADNKIHMLYDENYKIIQNMENLELNLKNREEECDNLHKICKSIESELNSLKNSQQQISEKINQDKLSPVEIDAQMLTAEIYQLKTKAKALNSQLKSVETDRHAIRQKLNEQLSDDSRAKIKSPISYEMGIQFPSSTYLQNAVFLTDCVPICDKSSCSDSKHDSYNYSNNKSIQSNLFSCSITDMNRPTSKHKPAIDFGVLSSSDFVLSKEYIDTLAERIISKLIQFQVLISVNNFKWRFKTGIQSINGKSINSFDKIVDSSIENQILNLCSRNPGMKLANNFDQSFQSASMSVAMNERYDSKRQDSAYSRIFPIKPTFSHYCGSNDSGNSGTNI